MNKNLCFSVFISVLIIPLSQAMEDDGTYSFSDKKVVTSQKRKREEESLLPEDKDTEKSLNESKEHTKKLKTSPGPDKDYSEDYDSYSHYDLVMAYFHKGDQLARQTLKDRISKGLITRDHIKNVDFSSLKQADSLSSLDLYFLISSLGTNTWSDALSNNIQKETTKNKPLAYCNVAFCQMWEVGINKDEASAFQWYLKAAEQGYAPGQYSMGMCYSSGKAVEQDLVKAFEWCQKAAEQGYVLAQYNLGKCYEKGRGVDQDLVKAFAWYQKAAEQEHVWAQYQLGFCYASGTGVDRDLVKAFEWCQKAAEQGYNFAQYQLGFYYAKGTGVDQDLVKAFEWCQKAAEQEHALAQYQLGISYAKGTGVDQDVAKAFEWFQKAAEQGHASAQYQLGICYAKGRGVGQDLVKAFECYYKAAEQGHASAQYQLGMCYAKGRGVDQDLVKAFEWYQKAAEQGHVSAQYTLGYLYKEGTGVEQDLVKAFEWCQKAADQGYAPAQYNLGYLYKHGEGGGENLVKTIEWYMKAATQGYKTARLALKSFFPGQDLTNSAQALINGSAELELTPDQKENIKYFKQNLAEIRAHLLWFYSISQGNLGIISTNHYLNKITDEMVLLVNNYLSIMENIDTPGFMVSCITECLGCEGQTINGTKYFFLTNKVPLGVLGTDTLFAKMSQLNEVFSSSSAYLKYMLTNNMPLQETINLTNLILEKSSDKILQSFFKDLFPEEKVTPENIEETIRETDFLLDEWLSKNREFLDFSKDLDEIMWGILESAADYQNNLFIKACYG